MLRARHLPYAVASSEGDQWMVCMLMALEDQQVLQPLADRLAQSFLGTADWMRNRPG